MPMQAKDKLRATWSKREDDLMLHYPLGSQTKSDGGMLADRLGLLLDELKRRGYDPTTVRFSIEPMAGNERFASQRQEDDDA